MVWAFIAAALVLRPNSSLAGVLGSSGLASAGSGRGLRLPLSCAKAAPGAPIADPSSRADNRVVKGCRAIIMGNLLGSCFRYPPPQQRQRAPNATPEEYVRLPPSQLRQPSPCVGRILASFR